MNRSRGPPPGGSAAAPSHRLRRGGRGWFLRVDACADFEDLSTVANRRSRRAAERPVPCRAQRHGRRSHDSRRGVRTQRTLPRGQGRRCAGAGRRTACGGRAGAGRAQLRPVILLDIITRFPMFVPGPATPPTTAATPRR
jgi:hypothetical protein